MERMREEFPRQNVFEHMRSLSDLIQMLPAFRAELERLGRVEKAAREMSLLLEWASDISGAFLKPTHHESFKELRSVLESALRAEIGEGHE